MMDWSEIAKRYRLDAHEIGQARALLRPRLRRV
jgi:hypothetical protein